jgi:hypothetical protein
VTLLIVLFHFLHLQYLGPCFAEKKVFYSMPMEHIDCRDNPALYESIPLESALQVWTYCAHEGTLKELKQKAVYGTSILTRLNSDACAEVRLCTLYFSQKISKKELKEQLSGVFNDAELLESFAEALRKMQVERVYCKMVSGLIFIVSAQNSVLSMRMLRRYRTRRCSYLSQKPKLRRT